MGIEGLQVTVVLHRPARQSNVGATARAMKVMGFTDLVLVAPAERPGAEAYAVAHGSHDVLDAARVVDSLDEAVRPATLVVGTTARQGKDRMAAIKLRKFVTEVLPAYLPARLAVLFGSEESGLSNADLEHCQYAVEIPTGELMHSLNLSHAVMVFCYELRVTAFPQEMPPHSTEPRRQRMEQLYRGIEAFLRDVGYPSSSSITRAMADAHRLLDTVYFTQRDVNTVLGLFRHIRYLLRMAAAE